MVISELSWTVHLLRYALGLRSDIIASGAYGSVYEKAIDELFPVEMDESVIEIKREFLN